MAPPVMAARRWLEGVTFPADRPLLNMSQAAPVDPPPDGMRAAMAEMVQHHEAVHLYGPVLGLPELRAEIADQWSADYGGRVTPGQVAITAGCNQAFCAAIATLASAGDAVILPQPWYFNHKMWLEMSGIDTVALPTGDDLLPDPDLAAALIGPRTRAIVLVSPNNPGGVEYPPALLAAFRDLARARGIALILDETYRDFHSRAGSPHDLFADPDWDDTLIQLYSFSKTYRLTGHRTGAILTSPARLAEVEKFLDTVAICAPQLGQHAALWGMRNLATWRAAERTEILDRRAAIEAGFPRLSGWTLRGAGAYFAWVEHPWKIGSDVLAPRMVAEAGVMLLPGTMFRPSGGTAGRPEGSTGQQEFRIAFANADRAGIGTLFDRLSEWAP
ncbi:aminotransferase [Mesobaculum littorinae]|uniref:aspartate transaminase n=1 Tax=Mesobaculum littorinae TaxID=2486419 RepID=A0A438AN23_9RHOB|nr:aminotransferase [Mesobaculum littorinae]